MAERNTMRKIRRKMPDKAHSTELKHTCLP